MSTNVPVRRPGFLSSWWPTQTSSHRESPSLLDALFRDGIMPFADAHGDFVPAVDLAESDEAIDVEMNVPGAKADDLDIQLNGNLLTVSGKVEETTEEKNKTYHRAERRVGHFSRSMTLPSSVSEERTKATLRDGVLNVHLEKSSEGRGRKISVTS